MFEGKPAYNEAEPKIEHWTLSIVEDGYWQPNSSAASTRTLYFPLNKLPNGSRLDSISVSGENGSGNLAMGVFRKSMKTGFAVNSVHVSSLVITATGTFGPGQSETGLIDITTAGSVDFINYEESNYYLKIDSGGSTTDQKIHGITINVIY